MTTPTPSLPLLSRRDTVKILGLGTAALAAGTGPLTAAAAGAAEDAWSLPRLPYGYAALEPHIDARTMEIHHGRHHQAYINAARKAVEPHPELLKMTPEQVVAKLATLTLPETVRMTLRNQLGGHVNHTHFWRILTPGGGEPAGDLLAAISRTFGSLEEFKRQFADAAARRFGSGWAWLSVREGKLMVHSTANQDSPLMEGAVPVIGVDVWEHAYYLKYQNLRADYVKAFLQLVNWTEAGRNYAAALRHV